MKKKGNACCSKSLQGGFESTRAAAGLNGTTSSTPTIQKRSRVLETKNIDPIDKNRTENCKISGSKENTKGLLFDSELQTFKQRLFVTPSCHLSNVGKPGMSRVTQAEDCRDMVRSSDIGCGSLDTSNSTRDGEDDEDLFSAVDYEDGVDLINGEGAQSAPSRRGNQGREPYENFLVAQRPATAPSFYVRPVTATRQGDKIRVAVRRVGHDNWRKRNDGEDSLRNHLNAHDDQTYNAPQFQYQNDKPFSTVLRKNGASLLKTHRNTQCEGEFADFNQCQNGIKPSPICERLWKNSKPLLAALRDDPEVLTLPDSTLLPTSSFENNRWVNSRDQSSNTLHQHGRLQKEGHQDGSGEVLNKLSSLREVPPRCNTWLSGAKACDSVVNRQTTALATKPDQKFHSDSFQGVGFPYEDVKFVKALQEKKEWNWPHTEMSPMKNYDSSESFTKDLLYQSISTQEDALLTCNSAQLIQDEDCFEESRWTGKALHNCGCRQSTLETSVSSVCNGLENEAQSDGAPHTDAYERHAASVVVKEDPGHTGSKKGFSEFCLYSTTPLQKFGDLHTFAQACRRWQNINVVLPLLVPFGTVVTTHSTGENTYVFSDTYPSSQLLFSSAGKVCNVWASCIRLRVAVIHKCPDFLVARVAQAFNDIMKDIPKFAEPVRLRCCGLVKHTIQLRSSGSLMYRYDTTGQVCGEANQQKMRVVFEALQHVADNINNSLAREVDDILKAYNAHQQHYLGRIAAPTTSEYTVHGISPVSARRKDLVDLAYTVKKGYSIKEDGVGIAPDYEKSRLAKSGLEFRFSPCRELKIAVREGSVCECREIDSLIGGGGAATMSRWAQQFIVEDLIAGEVRLERDKAAEMELDPLFLPEYLIQTRRISKDLADNPARACFVKNSVYPCRYRPSVKNAINLSPSEAARAFCGATCDRLERMLPHGQPSLKRNPFCVSKQDGMVANCQLFLADRDRQLRSADDARTVGPSRKQHGFARMDIGCHLEKSELGKPNHMRPSFARVVTETPERDQIDEALGVSGVLDATKMNTWLCKTLTSNESTCPAGVTRESTLSTVFLDCNSAVSFDDSRTELPSLPQSSIGSGISDCAATIHTGRSPLHCEALGEAQDIKRLCGSDLALLYGLSRSATSEEGGARIGNRFRVLQCMWAEMTSKHPNVDARAPSQGFRNKIDNYSQDPRDASDLASAYPEMFVNKRHCYSALSEKASPPMSTCRYLDTPRFREMVKAPKNNGSAIYSALPPVFKSENMFDVPKDFEASPELPASSHQQQAVAVSYVGPVQPSNEVDENTRLLQWELGGDSVFDSCWSRPYRTSYMDAQRLAQDPSSPLFEQEGYDCRNQNRLKKGFFVFSDEKNVFKIGNVAEKKVKCGREFVGKISERSTGIAPCESFNSGRRRAAYFSGDLIGGFSERKPREEKGHKLVSPSTLSDNEEPFISGDNGHSGNLFEIYSEHTGEEFLKMPRSIEGGVLPISAISVWNAPEGRTSSLEGVEFPADVEHARAGSCACKNKGFRIPCELDNDIEESWGTVMPLSYEPSQTVPRSVNGLYELKDDKISLSYESGAPPDSVSTELNNSVVGGIAVPRFCNHDEEDGISLHPSTKPFSSVPATLSSGVAQLVR